MPDQLSAQQTVPGLIELLQEHAITTQDIAFECKLDQEMVHDALSIFAFDSCPLFAVASVRSTLRRLLVENGWRGNERKIWGEYDIRILFKR